MATFRKLPSGNWQARVMVDGKYEPIGTFQTKKEAEIKAAEIERKRYYGETITDRDILFQTVIDDWYEQKKGEVKPPTLEQIEGIKRLHIEPFFGKKKLFKIRRDEIKDWVSYYNEVKNKKGEPKYSHGSKRRYLITLKEIFNYAVYNLEILNKSPAEKVTLPNNRSIKVKKDIKYHSLDDLSILLDYLSEYKPQRFPDYKVYHVLVYFLSRTGLRISEALALKWSDIQGNRLDVNKQTSRDDNNNLTITTLKNNSSYRNIEIDEYTIELLSDFRRLQNKMILKHDKFIRNKDMIIFQTYNGNYMTPSTVRDTIKSYCFNAGIEYKGTHGFRHTHAVLSLEAGADLLYISKRLGHKSIQTTADTYLDVTPQYESSELTKITRHLNSMWHEYGMDANNEK